MHELVEQGGQHLLLLLSIVGAVLGIWQAVKVIRKGQREAQERHDRMMLEQHEQTQLLHRINHELHPDGNGGTSMFDVLADTRRIATENRVLITDHIASSEAAFEAAAASDEELGRRMWELATNGGTNPQPKKMAQRHRATRVAEEDDE